jgi:hypothetical protein
VTLGALVEACAAERDPLIDDAVIADLRRLADYDAETVVDKDTPANFCARVNFDARQHPTQMRDKASQPIKMSIPQAMSQAMRHEGMQAWIAREDFELAARGRVSLQNTGYIFAKIFKHSADATAEEIIV